MIGDSGVWANGELITLLHSPLQSQSVALNFDALSSPQEVCLSFTLTRCLSVLAMAVTRMADLHDPVRVSLRRHRLRLRIRSSVTRLNLRNVLGAQ
jgi:hypothetical protein